MEQARAEAREWRTKHEEGDRTRGDAGGKTSEQGSREERVGPGKASMPAGAGMQEARQLSSTAGERERVAWEEEEDVVRSQMGMMMDHAEAVLSAMEQAAPVVVSTAEGLVAALERDASAVVAGTEALLAAKRRLEWELEEERKAVRAMEGAMQAQNTRAGMQSSGWAAQRSGGEGKGRRGQEEERGGVGGEGGRGKAGVGRGDERGVVGEKSTQDPNMVGGIKAGARERPAGSTQSARDAQVAPS